MTIKEFEKKINSGQLQFVDAFDRPPYELWYDPDTGQRYKVYLKWTKSYAEIEEFNECGR